MRATEGNAEERTAATKTPDPKDYAAAIRRLGDSVNDEMETCLEDGKTADVVALVGAQIMGALNQIALALQDGNPGPEAEPAGMASPETWECSCGAHCPGDAGACWRCGKGA